MVLFNNNKKIITGLILFSVCFSAFFAASFQPYSAQAQSSVSDALKASIFPPAAVHSNIKSLGGKFNESILEAANWVLGAISKFASKVISFEASILDWILNPESFRLATAPIVKNGWDVTRTTVNMFFVLVLLVVAFATILRIETYSLKAVLPRLIIVALLINFSLVIAGVILDFTNVMTNFFYQDLREGGDLGGKLVNGLKITNFYAPETGSDPSALAGLFTGIEGLLLAFVSLLLGVIFLLATIFVFAALIVMMLIRVLYLWVLLILAPAAWFFYIIPAWQNQWTKWWSNFFRWALFAPVAMFFIYLSVNTMDNIGRDRTFQGQNVGQDIEIQSLLTATQNTQGQSKSMTKNPVEAILQFAVGTGLLLGSLMVANSMSITGAGIATSLGKRMGVGIAGAAGSYMRKRTQPASGRLAQGLADAFDKTRIGRLPVFRQLSRPLHRYAESGRQYQKKLEEEAKKRSPEYLKNNFDKVGNQQKLAYSSVLADQNKLNTLDDGQIEKTLKLAEKTGDKDLGKKILNYDPTLVNKIGGNFLDGVMKKTGATLDDVLKQLKPKDWANMSSSAFKNLTAYTKGAPPPTMITNARGSHIAALASADELDKLDGIQDYITNSGATPAERRAALKKINPTLADYIDKQAGQFGVHY